MTVIKSYKAMRSHQFRSGDIVDFSKFKKSKTIVVCPRCGRKGRINRYFKARTRILRGNGTITHSKIYRVWCWDADDGCYFKKLPPELAA